MNVVRRYAPLAALLSTLLLAAVPLVSLAQHERDSADPPKAERMHQYLQQSMDRHLDHLAARLEIRASQQEAWKAFSTAVRAMVPAAPTQPPAKDLEATTPNLAVASCRKSSGQRLAAQGAPRPQARRGRGSP